MIYLIYLSYYFLIQPGPYLFIVNIVISFFAYMGIALTLVIIIETKKYENLFRETLHQLYALQFQLKYFKYSITLVEIVIICLVVFETTIRLSTTVYRFIFVYSVNETNWQDTVVEGVVIFIFDYFMVIRILSEGRLVLVYHVITSYLYHLNKHFARYEYDDVIYFFSVLQDLTENVNSMFSIMFLAYIAFNFLNILKRGMFLYCRVVSLIPEISIVDVAMFIHVVFNLLYFITIPYQCIVQVVT